MGSGKDRGSPKLGVPCGKVLPGEPFRRGLGPGQKTEGQQTLGLLCRTRCRRMQRLQRRRTMQRYGFGDPGCNGNLGLPLHRDVLQVEEAVIEIGDTGR